MASLFLFMFIEIYKIRSFKDLNLFWDMFDKYINHIFKALPSNKEDLNYFLSKDYRDSVIELFERDFNPLNIVFFKDKDIVLGFATYIIYIDERGKSIILEYCINEEYRNNGFGKFSYKLLEHTMRMEGSKYIELTPTNKRNESFWKSLGYKESMVFYEDGRCILKKVF